MQILVYNPDMGFREQDIDTKSVVEFGFQHFKCWKANGEFKKWEKKAFVRVNDLFLYTNHYAITMLQAELRKQVLLTKLCKKACKDGQEKCVEDVIYKIRTETPSEHI